MHNITKPSRRIPKNYRNITGKFSSKKSDRLISYESKLERDFLYLFEFENIVLRIVEQPITIKYTIDDKQYSYTPDFYLETPSGHNNIVIEVKYKNELKKNFKKLKPKFMAMKKYIKEKKKEVDFYIFTDECLYIKSDEYKFNVNFLLNYNDLPNNHFEIVKEIFQPYISIQEVLNQYSPDKFKQLELLNSVYCMIRRKILIIDMELKLGLNTPLITLRRYDEKIYDAHLDGRVIKGYLL